MKKIAIIIISLFLLLSAVNLGTSKPILNNESTFDLDDKIDQSVIDNLQEQQVLQNINRLDGYFTENQGQVGNDSVKYYIQGKGVWFLDDGVVFEIREPINKNETLREPFDRFHPEYEPEISKPRKSVVLKLNFEGCNKVEPKGINKLPHRSNYFYGNDSSKWCTNVPNFQEMVYENIYDDIDLKYYSNENGLKYDLIVRPGGNPKDIILSYDGAQDLNVDGNDNLIIQTSLGKIVDSELFIYQNSGNNKIIIDGEFKLIDVQTYGFKILNEFDKNEVLVIDPLVYSTFIGGNMLDDPWDIEIDLEGNSFITGLTESNDFPNITGSYDITHNDNRDVFILKLNSYGSSLIYSTYIGGNGNDEAVGIEIDSNCNAYVAGSTTSNNFPVTNNAYNNTYKGNWEIFILKLNPIGSTLFYSTYAGGVGTDFCEGLIIDSNNNALITGRTGSGDFPTTSNAFNTTHNGGFDTFVFILHSSGSTLFYSTFIGGSDDDFGNGISVDTNGNVYVTGWTKSSDFPTTIGANDTSHNGDFDVFVIKLNPIGQTIIYSTYIGGNGLDHGFGIAADSNGNAYITGETYSANFPTTIGANDTIFNGTRDCFLTKLNTVGSLLLFSTFIGGDGADLGGKIALDINNNIYITGWTTSDDLSITPDSFDKTYNGSYDGFLIKLNSTGTTILYSTYFGESGSDVGTGIKSDNYGNIYVAGVSLSNNFPITPGAFDTTYNGDGDIITFKLTSHYPPKVLNFTISNHTINRTNIVVLNSNGYDDLDPEKKLFPSLEYRDHIGQVWNDTYFSIPQYQNSRWEVGFTPPKNATLGSYDFRVKFNDTGGLFSHMRYLNNSLLVLNNIPDVDDIILSNNSTLLYNSISIFVNATDIEEIAKNLTVELEYRDPSETSWDQTYLNGLTYNNGRWESSFDIKYDALFGYYDFRARVNDSDEDYSSWQYLNDSLLVYNADPKVIDAGLSESSIYRTGSVSIYINGTDYETPEDMLNFYIQYKPQSESEWTNLTSNYINNRYEVNLMTYANSILGNYDFRVKFEDNESLSSGWKYINDSLEVLNNPPMISNDLDDIEVGIQSFSIDLTQYESDIEDSGLNLTWSIIPQIYTYIESIGIIDIINDTLEIIPKENVTGTEDIELILTDKDSGTAVKSDITINIDSTISEFTPKVTLLSPVNKAVINTLTPTLKWELDYAGTETITYTVALDESPDPKTTIAGGLTTNEYTLENELVDGKTYYWKVEPIDGICLSGAFSFTINLGFEPICKVNLTAETESVTIKQGATTDINLKITNEGNSIDNFKLEFSSANLQSNIDIDKTNVQLNSDVNSIVKLVIDIPDDFTIGDYIITVTATSLTDSIVKDEVTIDVKVVSKDFVPDYDASISISPTSLELEQGDSENVTITISNHGNVEDDFTVSFESVDFTSANVQFSDTSVPIADGDSDTITVTIIIPENMDPGVYTIKFIVESNDEPRESTLTITVKDKDGEEPGDKKDTDNNTMLYALIAIIVIIIVVLILLFIFLKKKKGTEEEPPVEEAPPPPEAVPPEAPPPEQLPTPEQQPEGVPPEVPPEQVPSPETPPSEQPPTPEVPPEQVPEPETPPPEQLQVPEVTPEQPLPPEVAPQVPQVEPAPEPAPMPQVEEQSVPTPQVEPQQQVEVQEPQGQAPVPRIKTPQDDVN